MSSLVLWITGSFSAGGNQSHREAVPCNRTSVAGWRGQTWGPGQGGTELGPTPAGLCMPKTLGLARVFLTLLWNLLKWPPQLLFGKNYAIIPKWSRVSSPDAEQGKYIQEEKSLPQS